MENATPSTQLIIYIYVAGGRIDQAHHDGRAKLALEEAFQFDLAVAAALNLTNSDDTLIIVTADHSHTLSINGYPKRGNDILGWYPSPEIIVWYNFRTLNFLSDY